MIHLMEYNTFQCNKRQIYCNKGKSSRSVRFSPLCLKNRPMRGNVLCHKYVFRRNLQVISGKFCILAEINAKNHDFHGVFAFLP